jgi:Raf kinase inhibitor-like YbhB/YbcL family protein
VGRIRFAGGRRIAVGLTAAPLLAALSGCGLVGTGTFTDAPSIMTVSSAAFNQDVLSARYTCHGAKLSPPVDWSGAPSATKSFALVVDDGAAPITPFVYWIVFDIGSATTDIQENQLPPGARVALNSAGQARYDPPCPDNPGHKYRFTMYALRSSVNLPKGASLSAAWAAIAAAAIARGRHTVAASP